MIADVTGNIGEASNMAAEVAGKASGPDARHLEHLRERRQGLARRARGRLAHRSRAPAPRSTPRAKPPACASAQQALLELSAKLKSLVVQFQT